MRTFVEIVDRGSLTAAAETLGLSQPAVVRKLAALEKHLGALLLRRTTRRMSLTPEGREFLERSRQILADIDDAERAVGQDDTEPRGEIRMTAPLEFGRMHVAPALTSFLWRYDRVRLDLLLLDRNVDLVNEGIDLALRIGALPDSSLIAVRVGEVRHVTVASPALLQRTGIPQHPKALSRLPCIRQQNMPRPETDWLFREDSKDLVVPVDGRFGCNQIAAAVSACVNGMGFGQFLSYQTQELVEQGALQIVLQGYEPSLWPVNLVYPGGRLVSSRQRALIAWLKDALPQRGAFA
ncbi:MAG TPA: LysR family transcriptional regulator [Woeseiaceae bacterium]|nr:LysR family transcriptional regulator [Woeseiaceae bacterium]